MKDEIFQQNEMMAGFFMMNKDRPHDPWTILLIRSNRGLTIECLQQVGDEQYLVGASQITPEGSDSLSVQIHENKSLKFSLTKFAFTAVTRLLKEQVAPEAAPFLFVPDEPTELLHGVVESFFEQVLESDWPTASRVNQDGRLNSFCVAVQNILFP